MHPAVFTLCMKVQYSLLDRRPANVMASFCEANGMSILPYGVVAGGFLSDRYLNLSARDVSVDTYSKGKYASVLGQAGGWSWLQQLLQVRAKGC
jgi:aryl-alcohol dehydrogenase-like predicted oxidoreductase